MRCLCLAICCGLTRPPPAHADYSKIDLCVSLGGDGTFLHLASLFGEDEPLPPAVSFAMGTLGFLTPFDVNDFKVGTPAPPACLGPLRRRLPHSELHNPSHPSLTQHGMRAADDPAMRALCQRGLPRVLHSPHTQDVQGSFAWTCQKSHTSPACDRAVRAPPPLVSRLPYPLKLRALPALQVYGRHGTLNGVYQVLNECLIGKWAMRHARTPGSAANCALVEPRT